MDVPKSSDNKLQLGGLVLGRTRGAASPAASEAGAIRDLVPFQPTTDRVFVAGDTLRLYARAFWRLKDTEAVTVTIALAGPTTMSPRTLTLNGARDPAGRADARLDTILPLAGLAPGRDELAVTATVRGQTAKRTLPFDVR